MEKVALSFAAAAASLPPAEICRHDFTLLERRSKFDKVLSLVRFVPTFESKPCRFPTSSPRSRFAVLDCLTTIALITHIFGRRYIRTLPRTLYLWGSGQTV